MIKRIINALFGAAHMPEHLLSVLDGSMKLRLKQMRYRTFSDFEPPTLFDHNVLRVFASKFNYQRIKHADRIGVTYWGSAKGDCNQVLAPVNYYLLLDGKKRTLQQQTAILEGSLDLPMGEWGQQLDCLHTFVASSTKQKIVGQYVQLSQTDEREFIPFSRSCEFDIEEGSAWSSPEIVDRIDNYYPDIAEWERLITNHETAAQSKKSRRKAIKTTAGASERAIETGNAGRRNRRKGITQTDMMEPAKCASA